MNKEVMVNIPVANGLLKFLYGSLLLQFTQEEVLHLFLNAGFKKNGIGMKNDELLKHIWDERKQTDQQTVFTLLNSLEYFFNKHDRYDLPQFMYESIIKLGGGVPYPPATNLWILESIVKYLLAATDFRLLILRHAHRATKRLSPNALWKVVDEENLMGNGRRLHLAICPDISLQTIALSPVSDIFLTPVLSSVPRKLEQSPFSNVECIAECMPANTCIGDTCSIEQRGEHFFLDGSLYGVQVPVDFLKNRYPNLPNIESVHTLPKPIMISQDYICPRRKRKVLRAGVIYGSPWHIFKIECKRKEVVDNSVLSIAAEDILNYPSNKWKYVTSQHTELINCTGKRTLIFTYEHSSISIWCDDKFITSGTQAKILYRILKDYVQFNKNCIERRSLLSDSNLVADPLNSCLTIRLKRISNRLHAVCPGFKLQFEGRGKISIATTCRIYITER